MNEHRDHGDVWLLYIIPSVAALIVAGAVIAVVGVFPLEFQEVRWTESWECVEWEDEIIYLFNYSCHSRNGPYSIYSNPDIGHTFSFDVTFEKNSCKQVGDLPVDVLRIHGNCTKQQLVREIN